MYSGAYYVDNNGFSRVQSLMPDEKESYVNSQFYNNYERSTTSSGGSNNLMPGWNNYSPGIQGYSQQNTDYLVNQIPIKPKLSSFDQEG